ncbi:septum formation family protein [Kitasatospora sp. NPDC096147]|uniref:septum formation family protein n=1 Tax=Kitasatospora sp. NPDC096147 TaxID=3364093 RepID=UPI00382B7E22
METPAPARPGTPGDGPSAAPDPFAAPSYPAAPGPYGQPGASARPRRRFGTGAVIGVVAAVGVLTVTAVLLATKGPAAVREAGDRLQQAERAGRPWEPGQCFRSADGELLSAEEVPCAEPHQGEVFAGFSLGGDAYPGEQVAHTLALAGCRRQQYGYLGDRMAVPTGVRIGWVMPTAASWALGARQVDCYYTEAEPRTGPIAKRISQYPPEQYDYLAAELGVNQVISQWPTQQPEQLPDGYREFARDLAKALRVESSLLDGVKWSDRPKRELSSLKQELEAAAAQADQVAAAPDTARLTTELERLRPRLRGAADLRFRSALGLPVAQPETRAA